MSKEKPNTYDKMLETFGVFLNETHINFLKEKSEELDNQIVCSFETLKEDRKKTIKEFLEWFQDNVSDFIICEENTDIESEQNYISRTIAADEIDTLIKMFFNPKC